jgi:hypothetical protein
MIAARLLQRVETNWERIAQAVIVARNSDPHLQHYRDLSDPEIRERVQDLTSNLALWLTTKDHDKMAQHFEKLGRTRYVEGMPLHEVIQKLNTIKRAIRTYASEQNFSLSAVEIYEELELLRSMAAFFDFVIYRVAKGYEEGLRFKIGWKAEESSVAR